MKTMRGIIFSVFACSFLFFSCSTTDSGTGLPLMTNVLVISNDGYENDWIQTNFSMYIDSMSFTSWSFVDSIPTMDQLNQYDVVLLYEDGVEGAICDSLGDRIHDYVMSGGNLVLGTFYWQDRSDGDYGGPGWGDLELIDPLIANYGYAYNDDSTGTWIDHPLTRGLDTIYCHYGGGYDSLRAGATAVAWWKSGDILMAYNKPGGRIVALTLWPYEPGDHSGKWNGFYRAWENALLYAAWGVTEEKTTVVPSAVTNSIVDFNKQHRGSERPLHGGSGHSK